MCPDGDCPAVIWVSLSERCCKEFSLPDFLSSCPACVKLIFVCHSSSVVYGVHGQIDFLFNALLLLTPYISAQPARCLCWCLNVTGPCMKVGDLKQSGVSGLERQLKGKVRGRSAFSSQAVWIYHLAVFISSQVSLLHIQMR